MGKDEVKKPLLSEQEPASSSTKSDLTARPDVKKVGCPKEIYPNEKRVAMTPSNVKNLKKLGYDCYIQASAGLESSFNDAEYVAAGAKVVNTAAEAWSCDMVFHLNPPTNEEISMMRKDGVLISFIYPAEHGDAVQALVEKQATCIAMDKIPRISRAQVYDALSSMANVAGYRAVVEASHVFPRSFMGQITAAGKVPPCKVLVIGAGVAGLAALGAAKGMGAVVRGFDTREACKEQVESMGAEFLTVNIQETGDGGGGYGKVMSKEFYEAELALFAQQAKEVDIIITTALIPNRRAPTLITEAMVKSMRPGSIIVDLAAEKGGNCECCVPGEHVVKHDVHIIGYTDLPSRLPGQSSTLYGNNMTKLVTDMTNRQEKQFFIDLGDEVVRGSCLVHQGVKLDPPPIKAAPAPAPAPPAKDVDAHGVAKQSVVGASWSGFFLLTLMLAALLGITTIAPSDFLPHLSVFVLAVFVGFHVIWGVTASLHSPLMSVTNAISGVILVGGIAEVGKLWNLPPLLAEIASVLAATNIFGGFLITGRMLGMFKKEGEKVSKIHYWYFIPVLLYVAGDAAIKWYYNPGGLQSAVFIAASTLFILSLKSLANMSTASLGNGYGMVGMTLAVLAFALEFDRDFYPQLGAAILIGCLVGCVIAANVEFVSLPQLVAMFHSFVGLAAVLVSFACFFSEDTFVDAHDQFRKFDVYIGVFIGGVTFTGSIVAWGKLQGVYTSAPLALPKHNFMNLLMIAGILGMIVPYMMTSDLEQAERFLYINTGVSFVLGIHLVSAIGGADMPVVISMLNSYSGWACAADGFMLQNDLLIIAGALVGSSGAILSYIMCKAMNRSFVSVIAGGFGVAEGTTVVAKDGVKKSYNVTDPEECAKMLMESRSVIITCGYGMAVGHAQHAVADITSILRKHGIKVRFCIHPVAGRMPGHMNVLLAEAHVPYDIVMEMDDINDEFGETDVVLVIGANDTINSDALTDPKSPLAGMPVCKVWESGTVVIFKRSMAAGYAGTDNPVFYNNNSTMFFGDAKKSCEALLNKLNEYYGARDVSKAGSVN